MKSQVLPFVLLLVFFSCGNGEDEMEAQKQRNAELVDQNISAHVRLDKYAAYVRQVEYELSDIRDRQESLVEFLELPSEVVSGDPIPSHLEAISEMLEESRFKLSSMREQLRGESKRISGLKKENRLIQERAASKLAELDSLEHRLTESTIALEIMHLQQTRMARTLQDAEERENTAWFAFGSKDELEAQRVTERKGGFLGIGARKVLSADLNTDYFTSVDTRRLNVLPLACDKAKLLSSHPSDSYRWVGTDSVEALEIVDPGKFWRNTRYLTIEVTQ